MPIRDYYYGNFRCDVEKVVGQGIQFGDDWRHYFGHTWNLNCRGLNEVPQFRQPEFLVCIYFTVLVDQAMHEYYPAYYDKFRRLTKYPKFCFGLGQINLNPVNILCAPISQNKVAAAAVEKVLGEAMELFVDEVIVFCRDYMPEIVPSDFFAKLVADRDVIPRQGSDDVWRKTYLALISAIGKRQPLSAGGAATRVPRN